jgi:hypothetical protein
MTGGMDGFTAAALATGCFQEHPDGSLATDMDIRGARSAASTMPAPRGPRAVRCRDGVLLCSPPGAAADPLRRGGWQVAAAPEGGAVLAWREAEPEPPPGWPRLVEDAGGQLLSRLSALPPGAVLGVAARFGGGGADEIAVVLSPSADAGCEALVPCADIEAGGRTFLVDAFRGSAPAGFAPAPTPSDKVSPPRR